MIQKMLKETEYRRQLNRIRKTMHDMNEKFSRQLELLQKTQVAALKLKNSINQIKILVKASREK